MGSLSMHDILVELITPSVALFISACFFALWRFSGLGRHVLAFAAAYTLSACGFLVAILLPPESTITFQISQFFYSVSAACIVWGACERVGQKAFLGVQTAVYLVAASMLILAVFLSQDAGPRLVISNTGYGIMLLVGVVSLLAAPRRRLSDNLVIGVLAINALDFLVRPSLTLLVEGQINVAAYHESIYFSLINLVLSVKAVVTATVLVAACVADYLAQLKESALHDDLTGLKSRAAFETDARDMMERGFDENRPVTLLIADIDHFKRVNDIWGHQAGDTAIMNFGSLFEDTVRGCDVSARVGGEEFCVVVWNCSLADGARLAERIRIAFAQMQHHGIGPGIHLTASFGVAQMRNGERYETLFARADAALYQAKENGRNVVFKDDESSSAPKSATKAKTQAIRAA